MKTTPAQLKEIYTLLPKPAGGVSKKELKESLVLQYTNNRTNSARDMQTGEAGALIQKLREMAEGSPAQQSANKMRRKIISMAYEMNHGNPYSPEGRKQTLQFIEGWCRSKGYLHKGFNEYTLQELPRLVSQFAEMHKKHMEGLRR